MSGLLGGDMPKQKLPEVKQTRMPRETDPTVLEASKRTRAEAMKRKGRMSTIMTDGTGSNVVGSSGKSLGA